MNEHAIWWHIYPLGALGAPIRPDWHDDGTTGRLRRLSHWLDYVRDLGCNGLLFGPLFASTTHGYDTTDHFHVDPRLGTNEDLEWLLAQCRERGLHVLFDGVFNHVGVEHPLTKAALAGEPSPVLVAPDGYPQHWEGHLDLAELDHSNPATEDLVVNTMEYWLERGISGWRLDVAYAVPNEFWRRVTDRVRQRFPQAFFLGEIIHGDYLSLIADGHLDSVTQYELWKAIWSSLSDVNMWELAHALERHADFTEGAYQIGQRDHRYYPPLLNTFIGNHDVDRIASTLTDTGAALATAIVFSVPGMPSIYQGDEQAFRGVKGDGVATDDQIRAPLPDSPAELSPAGAWMYRHYQALIGVRRRHPWIANAHIEVTSKTNERISYRVTQRCESGTSGTPAGYPAERDAPDRQDSNCPPELGNPGNHDSDCAQWLTVDLDAAAGWIRISCSDSEVWTFGDVE
ncbi:alpha-amylase family protein [Trueperella sp. LYQ141]|uniref:alpha-amylase family protein n=1 Tax=Trueperella sp. LYQ141 TaxID=3391058 RepID=UPI0039832FBD